MTPTGRLRITWPNERGDKARAAWLRDLDQRLVAAVPWETLPLEPRIDYALLRSRIAALRADLEEIRVPERNPALFLERAFDGVHLLLARSFAPLDERKEAAVARLMAIPDYLESVKPNLQLVPVVAIEAALEMADYGPVFVDEVVRENPTIAYEPEFNDILQARRLFQFAADPE